MGTSSNHPSPRTPTWQPSKAILGNPDWPTDKQSLELWRSALADRQGQLREELSNPIMAQACRIAGEGLPPTRAVQSFNNVLAEQYAAGLSFDMATRALARASAAGTGATGFASELFAESVSYYASRDLPSFVGSSGRIQTTSASIALKEQLRSIARDTARTVATVQVDNQGWRTFVANVLAALSDRQEGK